jgi:hypothetical protein
MSDKEFKITNVKNFARGAMAYPVPLFTGRVKHVPCLAQFTAEIGGETFNFVVHQDIQYSNRNALAHRESGLRVWDWPAGSSHGTTKKAQTVLRALIGQYTEEGARARLAAVVKSLQKQTVPGGPKVLILEDKPDA